MERLWKQVQPLYLELHAYVRKRLIAKYGAAAERTDCMIPAKLLNNMREQEWSNTYENVALRSVPPMYNLGQILESRHTDAKQMVRYGEGFFKSLGFDALPDTFWQRSMFTRPADLDVVCHASAWDLDNDLDVRLKVCLHPVRDDFITMSLATTTTRWPTGSSLFSSVTEPTMAFMKPSATRSHFPSHRST
jgi:peptidyl-dipeptidase A